MTLQDYESEAVGALQRAAIAGASMAAQPVLRALADGLRFGKYQIVRLIAIGGMSEVYEAIHLGLEKRVALKVLRPDLAGNPVASQRFVVEGIHAARIQHTNVVDVCDVGVVNDLPYLVMELLDGEDLGLLFDRHKQLPPHDLVDLLLPVAVAVAVGHSRGVLHRDLKPENIFLHREGRRVIPKVLDFGVSRITSCKRITVGESVFGTPHYMAPEQARGEPTDERTDQFALGVMLYEGLTGCLPREADNAMQLLHAIVHEPFSPPSAHVTLPVELEAVILRAMARDADQRFGSMYDLAMALVPFASESAREFWNLEIGRASPEGERETIGHLSLPGTSLFAGPDEANLPPAAQVDDTTPAFAKSSAFQAQSPRSASGAVRSATVVWLFAGSVLCFAGIVVWSMSRHSSGASSSARLLPSAVDASAFDLELRVEPSDATIELDGLPVGVGKYHARFPRNGSQHELRIAADGRIARNIRFQDAPPPAQITLTPSLPSELSEPAREPSANSPPLKNDVIARAAPRKPTSGSHPSKAATPPDGVVTSSHVSGADSHPSADHIERPAGVDDLPGLDPLQPRVRVIGGREPRVQLVD